MPQLIQMRQRMRAIKTIKKITHAMQLVAISNLLRLRSQKEPLTTYKNTVTDLFAQAYAADPSWHHPRLIPTPAGSTCIILVGSQKGLCANFNTFLCAFLERDSKQKQLSQARIITVGKKVTEYIKKRDTFPLIHHFDEFHIQNIPTLVDQLIHILCNGPELFSCVYVYSNIPKTFFLQKPQCIQLIPLITPHTESVQKKVTAEYRWEQPAHTIITHLAQQVVYTTLYELLFQSLLSEQAARFIAMEQATKNAGSLLDTMRLNYNKLRQSKITRELTDLIGGFF